MHVPGHFPKKPVKSRYPMHRQNPLQSYDEHPYKGSDPLDLPIIASGGSSTMGFLQQAEENRQQDRLPH
jgi:hypothetical protein